MLPFFGHGAADGTGVLYLTERAEEAVENCTDKRRNHGDKGIPYEERIPSHEECEAGKAIENVSILDLAPTIAKIMGVYPAREWEGKALV